MVHRLSSLVSSLVVRPSRRRIGATAAVLALVTLALAVAHARLLPSGRTLPGLTIDGADVPVTRDAAELRAWVESRAQRVRERPVRIVLASMPSRALREARLADLGVTVDVDAVVARATQLGHGEDLLARIALARRAAQHALDVPLAIHLDEAVVAPVIDAVKRDADVPARSARLDLTNHGVLPESDGAYIDGDAARAAILAASRLPEDAGDAIVFPVVTAKPRFTRADVEAIDVHATLGTYETYFSRHGDQARRGQNIDTAASKLDGLVLPPGEMFSFNEAVGARSEENGFQKSWEILKGEMVEGIGGGTCQVASTLHAIAFFGGLDVLERLPHSRPSAYIPMGLDATVVYPEVDLKLRNPYPFAVVVHAMVIGNRLRMELLGATKAAGVTFARELVETYPYKRKVEEDPKLRGVKVVLKQHGIRGYKVKRTRTLVFAGGRVKKESTIDKYPATTEIYEVPPGFDASLLPPLPVDDADDAADPSSAPPAAAPSSLPIAATPPASTVVPASPVTPPFGGMPTGAADPAAVACTGDCARPPDLVVVEAPGAHAPTAAQARPPKLLRLRR